MMRKEIIGLDPSFTSIKEVREGDSQRQDKWHDLSIREGDL